jgi:hypothetical protein
MAAQTWLVLFRSARRLTMVDVAEALRDIPDLDIQEAQGKLLTLTIGGLPVEVRFESSAQILKSARQIAKRFPVTDAINSVIARSDSRYAITWEDDSTLDDLTTIDKFVAIAQRLEEFVDGNTYDPGTDMFV